MPDEIDDFDDKEFSATERKRLRRMLRDDGYARHFKTTIRVWIITLGTVMSIAVAAKTMVWDTFIVKFLK